MNVFNTDYYDDFYFDDCGDYEPYPEPVEEAEFYGYRDEFGPKSDLPMDDGDDWPVEDPNMRMPGEPEDSVEDVLPSHLIRAWDLD